MLIPELTQPVIVQDLGRTLDHILVGLPALIPELILMISFVVSIVSSIWGDRRWRYASLTITLTGIVLSSLFAVQQLFLPPVERLFFGMITIDSFGRWARTLLGIVCLLFAIFVQSNPDFTNHRKRTGDLYAILLGVHLGLNCMVLSTNWLMTFLSIEMVSIGSYLLVGYLARNANQTEAALKYVLFGSVCSAMMLYGLSLAYGMTGTLDFIAPEHINGLGNADSSVRAMALLLIFVGIGFKLSLVPFHFWTPDVYQGAPTPVTALLSSAPKIAGIILLSRIYQGLSIVENTHRYLEWLLVLSAIVTMLWGNLAALRQSDVKRMMGYSSIGHTGFLLMAIVVYSPKDHVVLLFYLTVYALTNMGVFMATDYIENRTGVVNVVGYNGLGRRLPIVFIPFVALLVSLTGLPPMAGFVAKLLVFTTVFSSWQGSSDSGLLVLLIVGTLTTVISLFYYFKIPLHAFLRKEDVSTQFSPAQSRLLWLVVTLSIIVLLLGIFPDWLTDAF